MTPMDFDTLVKHVTQPSASRVTFPPGPWPEVPASIQTKVTPKAEILLSETSLFMFRSADWPTLCATLIRQYQELPPDWTMYSCLLEINSTFDLVPGPGNWGPQRGQIKNAPSLIIHLHPPEAPHPTVEELAASQRQVGVVAYIALVEGVLLLLALMNYL